MWLKRVSKTIGLKSSDTHVIGWYVGHDKDCHFVMESIVLQWFEATLWFVNNVIHWQDTFVLYSLVKDLIITADHGALSVSTGVKQNVWRVDRLEQDIRIITTYWKQSTIFMYQLKHYWKRFEDEKKWKEDFKEENSKEAAGNSYIFFRRIYLLIHIVSADISSHIYFLVGYIQ